MTTKPFATYAKRLEDGRYEYGYIQPCEANRKRDKMITVGIAPTYDIAQTMLRDLTNNARPT